MVLPVAIDPQIATGTPFAPEACPLQQLDRRRVVGQASCLKPVQLKRVEHEGNYRAHSRSHVALLRVFGTDPVAERAGLGHATANVAESEAANQRSALGGENEERIAHVLAEIAQVVAHAAAEGGAGQLVGGPKWLPGREKFAARGPELGPGRIVRHLRRAQNDLLGFDDRPKIARGCGSEQRHGLSRPFKPPWWLEP